MQRSYMNSEKCGLLCTNEMDYCYDNCMVVCGVFLYFFFNR